MWRAAVPLSFAIVVVTLSCRDAEGPDPEDLPPEFIRVRTLNSHDRTLAITIDPTMGRLVAVEARTATQGDRILLYDYADTGQLLASTTVEGSSALAKVDADVLVVGEGFSPAVTLGLPGLREVGQTDRLSGRGILSSADRRTFFVAGSGLTRITSDGQAMGDTLGLRQIEAAAIARDDRTVLVTTGLPPPPRFHAVSASDLLRIRSMELPVRVRAIVPMLDPEKVVVIGSPLDGPFRGPILSTVVDWATGEVGEVRTVTRDVGVVSFGFANPSAMIDPTTVLVATNTGGTLSVNIATGIVRRLRDSFFEGGPPCCVIAYDPIRDWIIAAENRGTFEVGGRIVVYERR